MSGNGLFMKVFRICTRTHSDFLKLTHKRNSSLFPTFETPFSPRLRPTGLLSGIEVVLLVVYSAETKARNGKPVKICIPDLYVASSRTANGGYVLPNDMLDFLDAPVPYIVKSPTIPQLPQHKELSEKVIWARKGQFMNVLMCRRNKNATQAKADIKHKKRGHLDGGRCLGGGQRSDDQWVKAARTDFNLAN
ncbi:DENN (AEX-3) domain-containing protein [Striga asiatica]|uniref:DENN (AEX-3) domain-containing protein n=1 Tax=Striga asiatica TaxID=4170 RepID=A0A5A7Q8J6_STRAF|nr:DENN (AEX-3) domain-containing protein [Striga asiatica]